ncbi:MAG TPA: hypothetical protein VFT95_13305 [Micromonosporaceae bacterium]|nr:hypothetical protein [Micromonosporaceae bacterium]
MNPKTSARILIAASVAYGVAIGILGGLWVIRGLYLNRDRTS